MIPVGQTYRPAGQFELRSILVTAILGTVTAILGAVLIWLWEISPLPTLVLITPILQGIIVGGVFGYMVGRLQMRNPRIAAVVAFSCGLLSYSLVHVGHHLQAVSSIAAELRSSIESDASVPAEKKSELLAKIDADPAAMVDPFLVMRTGSSGLLGTLKLRNELGVQVKGAHVTGWFLWLLWGAEALLVAGTGAAMASAAASKPYCEDCGYWCHFQPDLLVLPGVLSEPLVKAVSEDNLEETKAVINKIEVNDGTGLVGVSLHSCPHCEQSFADISHRVKRGNAMKIIPLTKQLRVSPEMANVIKAVEIPSETSTAEADARPHQALAPDGQEGEESPSA